MDDQIKKYRYIDYLNKLLHQPIQTTMKINFQIIAVYIAFAFFCCSSETNAHPS